MSMQVVLLSDLERCLGRRHVTMRRLVNQVMSGGTRKRKRESSGESKQSAGKKGSLNIDTSKGTFVLVLQRNKRRQHVPRTTEDDHYSDARHRSNEVFSWTPKGNYIGREVRVPVFTDDKQKQFEYLDGRVAMVLWDHRREKWMFRIRHKDPPPSYLDAEEFLAHRVRQLTEDEQDLKERRLHTKEQYMDRLLNLYNRRAYTAMVPGQIQGMALQPAIMNLIILRNDAISLSDVTGAPDIWYPSPEGELPSELIFKPRKKSALEKTGGKNLKNSNRANQYDIFDSSQQLRKYVLDQLNHIIESSEKEAFCIVDPCCGLGRLTPIQETLEIKFPGKRFRVLAYDLIVPTTRNDMFRNTMECKIDDRENCELVTISNWDDKRQAGTPSPESWNFFDGEPSEMVTMYGLQDHEQLIFVMNPPFTLRKVDEQHMRDHGLAPNPELPSSDGVLEFLRRCSDIARAARHKCHVLSVSGRGFADWWKPNWTWKETAKTAPSCVQIKARHLFRERKKNMCCTFMRVSAGNNPRYDELSTDVMLGHYIVHGDDDSFDRRKFNVSMDSTQHPSAVDAKFVKEFIRSSPSDRLAMTYQKSFEEFGFAVGFTSNKLNPTWFDMTNGDRKCPPVVRNMASPNDLGMVLSGCPSKGKLVRHPSNHNSDNDVLINDWGWKSEDGKKKKDERQLIFEDLQQVPTN